MQTFNAWLWPDRTIGKRESRQLREEHNALLNAYDKVKTAQRDGLITSTTQIDTRYRMFRVTYSGPTASGRGSRVVIRDLRHNKTVILHKADKFRDSSDQAANHLESIGISVDAMGLADLDADCLLLSRDISTPLRK